MFDYIEFMTRFYHIFTSITSGPEQGFWKKFDRKWRLKAKRWRRAYA